MLLGFQFGNGTENVLTSRTKVTKHELPHEPFLRIRLLQTHCVPSRTHQTHTDFPFHPHHSISIPLVPPCTVPRRSVTQPPASHFAAHDRALEGQGVGRVAMAGDAWR